MQLHKVIKLVVWFAIAFLFWDYPLYSCAASLWLIAGIKLEEDGTIL